MGRGGNFFPRAGLRLARFWGTIVPVLLFALSAHVLAGPGKAGPRAVLHPASANAPRQTQEMAFLHALRERGYYEYAIFEIDRLEARKDCRPNCGRLWNTSEL